MTAWEHLAVRVATTQDLPDSKLDRVAVWDETEARAQQEWQDKLNVFGMDGWELVSEQREIERLRWSIIIRHTGTMKRPILG